MGLPAPHRQTHIYTLVQTQLHTDTHIYTLVQTQLHTSHTHIRIYMHTYTQRHKHLYTLIQTCIYIYHTHIPRDTRTYTHIYTHRNMYLHTHIYTLIYPHRDALTQTHMHTYTRTHTHRQAYTHIRIDTGRCALPEPPRLLCCWPQCGLSAVGCLSGGSSVSPDRPESALEVAVSSTKSSAVVSVCIVSVWSGGAAGPTGEPSVVSRLLGAERQLGGSEEESLQRHGIWETPEVGLQGQVQPGVLDAVPPGRQGAL